MTNKDLPKPTKLLPGEPFKFGRDKFVFLHIPKTSGTSLHAMFREDIFGRRYSLISSVEHTEPDYASLDGIGGHFPYGMNYFHLNDPTSVVYVTMLRDPFSRFMSFYWHVQHHETHHLRQAYPCLFGATPLEFARILSSLDDPEVANLQSRMLAPGVSDAKDVIAHIEENYSIVGTMEKPDLFYQSLQEMFPNYLVENRRRLNIGEKKELIHDRNLEYYVLNINDIDAKVYEHFNSRI